MVHRRLWVVDESPSPAPDREAERQVVVDLRAGPAKAFVEAQTLDRIAPVAHVGAFEHIDISRPADPDMVVSHDASEPAYFSDHGPVGRVVEGAVPKDVTAPDATDPGIGIEVALDAGQPVRPGRGVVVGDRDDVAMRRLQTCVQRRHLAR